MLAKAAAYGMTPPSAHDVVHPCAQSKVGPRLWRLNVATLSFFLNTASFALCLATLARNSHCQANSRPVKLPLPVAVSSPAAWPSSSSASVALWRRACCSGIPGSNRHSVAPPPQPNRSSASCSAPIWFPCPTCPCFGGNLGRKTPASQPPSPAASPRRTQPEDSCTSPGPGKPASAKMGQQR